MLAVLAAVTEVIKEQGGKETTTEYFAALASLFSHNLFVYYLQYLHTKYNNNKHNDCTKSVVLVDFSLPANVRSVGSTEGFCQFIYTLSPSVVSL